MWVALRPNYQCEAANRVELLVGLAMDLMERVTTENKAEVRATVRRYTDEAKGIMEQETTRMTRMRGAVGVLEASCNDPILQMRIARGSRAREYNLY